MLLARIFKKKFADVYRFRTREILDFLRLKNKNPIKLLKKCELFNKIPIICLVIIKRKRKLY